jgi:hypothetical protein
VQLHISECTLSGQYLRSPVVINREELTASTIRVCSQEPVTGSSRVQSTICSAHYTFLSRALSVVTSQHGVITALVTLSAHQLCLFLPDASLCHSWKRRVFIVANRSCPHR